MQTACQLDITEEASVIRASMRLSKPLISVCPAPWNVTTAYLNKRDDKRNSKYGLIKVAGISNSKLDFIRTLPTIGTMERKQLTVTVNGLETVYTLGKKNEYYNAQGMALTKTLETLATEKGNKISIQ